MLAAVTAGGRGQAAGRTDQDRTPPAELDQRISLIKLSS